MRNPSAIIVHSQSASEQLMCSSSIEYNHKIVAYCIINNFGDLTKNVVLDPQFPDLVSKTLIMTLGSKPNYYLSAYEKNAVAGHHNIKWEYSGVLKCFHCINPQCIQHGLLTDIQSDYRPDIKNTIGRRRRLCHATQTHISV